MLREGAADNLLDPMYQVRGLKFDLERGLKDDLERGFKDDLERGLKFDLERGLKFDLERGLEDDLSVFLITHHTPSESSRHQDPEY